jgi:hypothetical protein
MSADRLSPCPYLEPTSIQLLGLVLRDFTARLRPQLAARGQSPRAGAACEDQGTATSLRAGSRRSFFTEANHT